LRIERISDNKIKVTISYNDLEERNNDLSAMSFNSPAAQELFWDMMEQAETELGFNASDAQLIIEPDADENEGFIVIITKVNDEGDFESIQKYIKNKMTKKDLKSKKRSRKVYSTAVVYSFSDLDDVISLCRNIGSLYSGESTLYRFRETYYLTFVLNSSISAAMKKFEALLGEYGAKVKDAKLYKGYLNEYGDLIAEGNAIETVSRYF
jgi:adapter protein MecA 1/2